MVKPLLETCKVEHVGKENPESDKSSIFGSESCIWTVNSFLTLPKVSKYVLGTPENIFIRKKTFFKQNLIKFSHLQLQNTRFKELLKKLNFEGFSWNWKNFKTLILQACRSVSRLIYASKSVHYYPRTSPEALGSYGYPYFGSIRFKLDTHV